MVFLKIVAVILLVYVVWSWIEQKHLVTTRYRIASRKLGKEFDNSKIVVLADLHNHTFGRRNQKLLHKINLLSPDYILIAGDMITKHQPSIPGNAFCLMEELAKHYPVYYAYGNHEQYLTKLGTEDALRNANDSKNPVAEAKAKEQRELLYSTWTEYLKKLKDLGVVFLDNNGVTLTKNDSKVRISGVSIEKKYFEHFEMPVMEEDYLTSLVEKKEKAYQILLAHNPIYFKNYVNWGADLILSGHLHGGIVRLPGIGGIVSPQVNLLPKYDSGRFVSNDQEMIVSRGLGTHSAMLRLFNRPELIFITLHHKQ